MRYAARRMIRQLRDRYDDALFTCHAITPRRRRGAPFGYAAPRHSRHIATPDVPMPIRHHEHSAVHDADRCHATLLRHADYEMFVLMMPIIEESI